MAGFAFTALVQSNTLALDYHAIKFEKQVGTAESSTSDGAGGTSTVHTPFYAPMFVDPWSLFSFLMHVGQLISVLLCLGEMLRVITEGLIAVHTHWGSNAELPCSPAPCSLL